MADQPTALRLADRLQCNVSRGIHWDAASELRRLHDIEKAYESACGIFDEQDKKLAELEAINAELLEALKYHQEQTRPIERTRAAIAKSEIL
jgi:hypothetical protein